jgi:hypothetical protein
MALSRLEFERLHLVSPLLLYCATIYHVSVECASFERIVVRPVRSLLSCV